jgi:hypothetical protein
MENCRRRNAQEISGKTLSYINHKKLPHQVNIIRDMTYSDKTTLHPLFISWMSLYLVVHSLYHELLILCQDKGKGPYTSSGSPIIP